jgi:hypothetical protein
MVRIAYAIESWVLRSSRMRLSRQASRGVVGSRRQGWVNGRLKDWQVARAAHIPDSSCANRNNTRRKRTIRDESDSSAADLPDLP